MMELNDNDEKTQHFKIITEKQKENFRNRMSMLVLEKSTPAIKVVFDKEIHPDQLKIVLVRNYKKLHKLCGRNILTAHQWSRLFPGQGCMPVSSNMFDGTLMICLLRNLTDLQISDRLPLATDISRNADLSRLHYYRNMIVHIDGQFDYSKSDAALDDCIQAIQRLSGMDCNDYKTKLFGDCSKDSRVVFEALLFLYSEGCDLGRIGLSCAFWELTHIEQMGKLLCLCVYYQLLEPVIFTLWKDLTEGKQYGVDVRFLNGTLNGDITGEVQKWELLPSRSVTYEYRDEERRNSYLLYLAAMRIKRCTFKNRKSKNEDDHIHKIPGTEPLTMYEHEISAASSAHLGDEESIHQSVFPDSAGKSPISFGQLQLLVQRNSSQSFCATEDYPIVSVFNPNETYYNNNASNITDSVLNTLGETSSYSFFDLLSTFSISDLLPEARNDSCSLYDTRNVSNLSVAITNESVWNNSLSNGTDLASYTGFGKDTG